MCFSSPSIPAMPAIPQAATAQDQSVVDALDRSRKARAMAAGRASTILTGPQGVDMAPASTAPKTVLGG